MSTAPIPWGLYALVDDGVAAQRSVVEKATAALAGGVKVLQLRLKRTPTQQALAAAREVVALCNAAGAVCIINDRVDWVLLSGAQGVHLGDEDLPVPDARRLLGPSRIIGATVRSLEGAQAAAKLGASYVGAGPVFQTHTKQVPHAVIGVEGLRLIVEGSPIPVVAIAGIGLSNIAEVAAAGAHGAAVAQDLWSAEDPAERARALARSFVQGRARRTIRSSE